MTTQFDQDVQALRERGGSDKDRPLKGYASKERTEAVAWAKEWIVELEEAGWLTPGLSQNEKAALHHELADKAQDIMLDAPQPPVDVDAVAGKCLQAVLDLGIGILPQSRDDLRGAIANVLSGHLDTLAQPPVDVDALGLADEALKAIAEDPHCEYGKGEPYSIGVTDGHRCAANKAKAARENLAAFRAHLAQQPAVDVDALAAYLVAKIEENGGYARVYPSAHKLAGWVRAHLAQLPAPGVVEALRPHLEEIAQGLGPYSRDQMQHAENTIDNAKRLATKCLAILDGQAQGAR